MLTLLKIYAEDWDTVWRWWRAVHIEEKAFENSESSCTELFTVIRNRGAPLMQNVLGSMEGHCCCSVAKSCLTFVTLWILAHQAPLSFSISWSLLKLMSIESVMSSNHLTLCCPLLLSSIFLSIRVFFQWVNCSGGQRIGTSALASYLPVNIQGWFPLGLTYVVSLLSKGLWRVFSSTTVWKHQFFGTQPSLWSNSHIHTWLLEKPQLQPSGPLSAKWYLSLVFNKLSVFP